MRKIEREYRAIFGSEGVEVLEVRHRAGHFAFSTIHGTVFLAGTPSDCRNLKQLRAHLRRIARD
jgi:hypothetical protein